MNELANLDIAFIVFYFLVLIGIAIYFSREENDPTGYFLAGRNIGWVAIGTSVFASNISSEHFIAFSGVASSNGVVIGNFEWISCLVILFFGWFMAPILLKSGVFTIPEFLGKRYNQFTRLYMTAFSIIGYVSIKITVTLFAGSLLMHEIFGWDISSAAIAMIIIAGFYAIVGGLRTIVHIDILQTALLVTGAIILTVFGLKQIGGISELHATLPNNFFTMFKPVSKSDFPISGIILGAPIIAVWYWCTDQAVAQRVMAAKNIDYARTGVLLAGFFKLLPMFLFVLPGLILATLHRGETSFGTYSVASFLSNGFLPAGFQGIVIVGLLAPMISCLASCFNSSSTLFTMDFYRYFHPEASEQKLVLVGRLASVALVLIAILWTPLMLNFDSSIYGYLQRILAYLGPPVVSILIAGLVWQRLNAIGATWALVVGTALGLLRLTLEVWVNTGNTVLEPIKYFVEINFLHFAVLLFVISTFVFVTVSFFANSRSQANKIDLIFSKNNFQDALNNSSWQNVNFIITIILVLLIVSLLLLIL